MRKLKVVGSAPPASEPWHGDQPAPKMGPDIYAADRAKIASIDWAAIHIRGDRAKPVSFEAPRRGRALLLGHGLRFERGGFVEEGRP